MADQENESKYGGYQMIRFKTEKEKADLKAAAQLENRSAESFCRFYVQQAVKRALTKAKTKA